MSAVTRCMHIHSVDNPESCECNKPSGATLQAVRFVNIDDVPLSTGQRVCAEWPGQGPRCFGRLHTYSVNTAENSPLTRNLT